MSNPNAGAPLPPPRRQQPSGGPKQSASADTITFHSSDKNNILNDDQNYQTNRSAVKPKASPQLQNQLINDETLLVRSMCD